MSIKQKFEKYDDLDSTPPQVLEFKLKPREFIPAKQINWEGFKWDTVIPGPEMAKSVQPYLVFPHQMVPVGVSPPNYGIVQNKQIPVDYGLQFNGSSAYGKIPASPVLTFDSADSTYAFWTSPDHPDNQSVIFHKEGKITVRYISTGHISIELPGVGTYEPYQALIMNGRNCIIIVIEQRRVDQVRIRTYINGVNTGRQNMPGASADIDADIYFGAEQGNSSFYPGKIDEVRIWAETLSGGDADDFYNGGAGTEIETISAASLRGGWHCNENEGTVSEDFSVNNNFILLVGGVVWTDGLLIVPQHQTTGVFAPFFAPGIDQSVSISKVFGRMNSVLNLAFNFVPLTEDTGTVKFGVEYVVTPFGGYLEETELLIAEPKSVIPFSPTGGKPYLASQLSLPVTPQENKTLTSFRIFRQGSEDSYAHSVALMVVCIY